jgi:hypothetical protein
VSPTVEDCLALVRKIESNPGVTYTVQVASGQKELDHSGGCRFGAEPTWVGDNLWFTVGGQDMIDIINDAIKQFGGTGRVGARGWMDCLGTSAHKPYHGVMWGIY